MKKIYLDNAATTPMRPEVIRKMVQVMTDDFGNPSSTHSFGRHAKSVLELSRKTIAKILNASAREIIFTSGATEANNWVLRAAIQDLKVQRIITSTIEHHAVLHTVEAFQKEFSIQVDYVKLLANGHVDITHLVELLSENIPTLVSLMHVNNEIGTVLDLDLVSRICKQHNAYFHSDAVQSIGKASLDLQQIPLDFVVASAHKFHGPKGIGFAFIRKGLGIRPLFFGGEQEKGLRPGTESLHNIAGMAKALEISDANLSIEREAISALRKYAVTQFQDHFPDCIINGDITNGFYTILNVGFPFSEDKTAMLLFNLDMKGIAVSRGSACQSGSIRTSHVLAQILSATDLLKPSLRISFSHLNTIEEIDYLVAVLKTI